MVHIYIYYRTCTYIYTLLCIVMYCVYFQICFKFVKDMVKLRNLEIYLEVIMMANEHWMSVVFNIVDVCQEPPDEEMAKVAAGADDRRQEIPNNKFDRSCFQVKYVMFYVIMFLAFKRRSSKLEFSRWIPCRCQEIDDRDGLESRGATWKNTEGTCGVFVRMFGGTYPCAVGLTRIYIKYNSNIHTYSDISVFELRPM